MEHIFTAKVIDSHRLTIPEPVWDLLGIYKGDYVKITLEKIAAEEKRNAEV